jgi:hypothetical protein
MKNSEVVGKFVIVDNLNFTDFMKDENGNINVYDTLEEACSTCGMYEFEDAIVLKIEYNHIEPE